MSRATVLAHVGSVILAAGNAVPLPPEPILANLEIVSPTIMETSGGQTWWLQQQSLYNGQSLRGATSTSGLAYFTEGDSVGKAKESRLWENPNFFDSDEHNGECVLHLRHGGSNALFAVVGHSNAVVPNLANNGRIQFSFSPDGTLAQMRQKVTFTMSGGSATTGPNYGQWLALSATKALFWTNQDNDASWGFLTLEIVGETLTVTENKRVFRNTPGGNQAYSLAIENGSNKATIYVQPHPLEARNIIRALDMDLTTGEISDGLGTIYGNAYAPYDGTAMINFLTTPTAGRAFYDPGAGRSVRLMSAKGGRIAGCHFASSDGTGPMFFVSDGTTVMDLISPGTSLDLSRRYYRGLAFAEEPHSGVRLYMCARVGNFDYLYRVDMAAVASGGAYTLSTMARSNINAGPESKLIRPHPYMGATDKLAIDYTVGRWTGYSDFFYGKYPLGSDVGTVVLNDTFTEASAIALNLHVSDTGHTWSNATDIGSGVLNVGTNGRTYCTGNATGGALSSYVMTTQNVDMELVGNRRSSLTGLEGAGVCCTAGVHSGYYVNLNNAATGLYTVSRFENGNGQTIISFSASTILIDQDVVRLKIRDSVDEDDNPIKIITLVVNGRPRGSYIDTAPLNGTRVKIRNSGNITSATTGIGLDQLTLYEMAP